jgi:hypothetical protein
MVSTNGFNGALDICFKLLLARSDLRFSIAVHVVVAEKPQRVALNCQEMAGGIYTYFY